jgi:uncharacterized protein (PEP-CTERM system associated)
MNKSMATAITRAVVLRDEGRPAHRRAGGARGATRLLNMRSLVWLTLVPYASFLAQAQTRPLVNAEDEALAKAEAAARAFSAARAWRFEPTLGATATATNNRSMSFGSTAEKDIVTDIEPRLNVYGRSSKFTFQGSVGAHLLLNANSTPQSRVLPQILPAGLLTLNANVIDRWLYFDAAATAEQVASDPYGARVEAENPVNKLNSLSYRFSPYLQHAFTPSLSLLARSDSTWSRRRGEFSATDPRRNSSVQRESVIFEQKPQPLGLSIEGFQEETRFVNTTETLLLIGRGQAVVTYLVDPTFSIGIVGGKEKSKYALTSSADQIVGTRILWIPTERTELKGVYEQRFFGTGGSLELKHRSPFFSLALNVSREPSILGTSFVLDPAGPTGGDVRTLLDEIFKTRYPNPADRAVVVGSVISGLGVPSVLGQPVEVFSDYAQLTSAAGISLIFQGSRSTVIARLYARRSRQLRPEDTPFIPTLGIGADNTQEGLSLDFNRRLTRSLSVDLGLGLSSIKGLAAATGLSTKNAAIRLGFTQALTPKTKATLGARYQRVDQVAIGQDASAKEIAAFVGMVHSF